MSNIEKGGRALVTTLAGWQFESDGGLRLMLGRAASAAVLVGAANVLWGWCQPLV
jgi:hypothetical protein